MPLILGGILAVAVVVVAFVGLIEAADGTLPDVGNNLANSLANMPPDGVVWFGESFDPATLELDQRLQTVTASDTFAVVGSLTEATRAAEMNVRVSFDGDVVSNEAFDAKGISDIWGLTAGPVFRPGWWTYEFTDIGGNVLATGDILVSSDEGGSGAVWWWWWATLDSNQ